MSKKKKPSELYKPLFRIAEQKVVDSKGLVNIDKAQQEFKKLLDETFVLKEYHEETKDDLWGMTLYKDSLLEENEKLKKFIKEQCRCGEDFHKCDLCLKYGEESGVEKK